MTNADVPDRNVGDIISRQAAIDTLNDGAELLRRVLDETYVVGNERAKYEWGIGLIESYISDMDELPSANPRTCEYFDTESNYCALYRPSAQSIDRVPSAEQKKGHWISSHSDIYKVGWDEQNPGCPAESCYCSVCGDWLTASDEYPAKGNFCPNCGADMRGGEEE